MRWVRGLALNRPLTVLVHPGFWIICTAHGVVGGPVALPAGVRVVHVGPVVPHVPLGSAAGIGAWGWSTTHHAVLGKSLPASLHAITSIWVREWALHGPTIWVAVLAIHVRLLAAVLHTIGFALVSFSWRAVHPFARPLVTLQSQTNIVLCNIKYITKIDSIISMPRTP